MSVLSAARRLKQTTLVLFRTNSQVKKESRVCTSVDNKKFLPDDIVTHIVYTVP